MEVEICVIPLKHSFKVIILKKTFIEYLLFARNVRKKITTKSVLVYDFLTTAPFFSKCMCKMKC